MSTQYAFGRIITDGLILSLDAADRNSYVSGSTTWFDTSGHGNNFTFANIPTFVAENGGGIFFLNNHATGGTSNRYNITMDCTIEVILKPTLANTGVTFRFSANGTIRALHAHTPYGSDYFFNTMGQSISFSDPGNTLINKSAHFVFRRRSSLSPYIEIIRNNVQRAAGTNVPFSMDLDTRNVFLGGIPTDGEFFEGNIYVFRVYNRALSDAEITQNFNVTKARFGL